MVLPLAVLSPGGIIEYSYDDAGRITSWRIDNADTDGIFDSVTTYDLRRPIDRRRRANGV